MGWNIFWRFIQWQAFSPNVYETQSLRDVKLKQQLHKMKAAPSEVISAHFGKIESLSKNQSNEIENWLTLIAFEPYKKGSKRNTFEQDGEKIDMGAYCVCNRCVGIDEPKCGLISESFSVWLESPFDIENWLTLIAFEL